MDSEQETLLSEVSYNLKFKKWTISVTYVLCSAIAPLDLNECIYCLSYILNDFFHLV